MSSDHYVHINRPAFERRLQIAKDICSTYLRDHALPDWALQLHLACPMWAFYLRKEDGKACRVYGVIRGDDEIGKVHVITAVRRGETPDLSVMKPNQLQLVHEWPPHIEKLLRKDKLDQSGLLSDPMGFIGILENYCHDHALVQK